MRAEAAEAEAEAEAGWLAAQEVAEERERALKARLAAIEAREAQTRVAGERSRKQLAEAKARAGVLEWSMQLQASAAREQADAINASG